MIFIAVSQAFRNSVKVKEITSYSGESSDFIVPSSEVWLIVGSYSSVCI